MCTRHAYWSRVTSDQLDGFICPCVACSSRRMLSLSRASACRALATLESMQCSESALKSLQQDWEYLRNNLSTTTPCFLPSGLDVGHAWVGQALGPDNLQKRERKPRQKLVSLQLNILNYTTNISIRCICGSPRWTVLTYFHPFNHSVVGNRGDDLGQSQPEDINRRPRRS